MKLLEIVKGSKTSLPVLNNCIKLAKKIGKVPVTVGVCDGFVGNRMIHRYLKEANHLLEEGALPKDVDDAIEEFGFAMGPFKMSDLAGLDIGWAIRKRRKKNNLDKHKYSNIPDRICEGGDFGQKTGKGYYDYSDGPRNPKPNEKTNKIIVSESDALNITRRSISNKEIVSRLMLSLITEGLDLLDENIASRPSDIDVIYSYGYGFPRYRGGPMFHANTIGVEKIVSEIEEFSKLPNCDHWKIGNRLLKIKNGEINFI
jgi:3-hydroxyacyl-CoA dehydrogenase